MDVFKNSQYRISFQQQGKVLNFHWLDDHENMTYQDFQEACSNFMGYGFEYQAQQICIDVRNFKLQLPEDFPEWQLTEHYPRYFKLGIQKVAYIMPEAALAYAKEIDKEPGKFELRNFSDNKSANQWLN